MRAFFMILLAVATLLISSNAATVNPQASHDLTQSTDANDVKLRSGRLLRIETMNNQATDTIDEERAAIPEVLKKLWASTSKWFGDKTLATKLHYHAMKMKLDDIAEKLATKGVDPNRAYRVLKLEKDSNRYVNWFESGEFTLWKKLAKAYQDKNPTWKNHYADA
ncbi:hypothetical protein F441_03588 [Phytophthora nicotianae CJ01A1]|uniref:RxLR effector protein n=4 Tax=Phytophthora nicotianae TaxID=4792 RepID=W2QKM9_PHYN3|nr:hypothetical protein PPTG_08451 [Phytophthora nicotianae INRA-310]ETN13708.1 hypothetical protein PPTG_08451 [Phytophthora nicotianae INRA-310]ETP23247.1 hypothetical protein F441_03588 [Phytophthora nicotianae CJ01A1]KUF88502.1 hypothetical protein AM587_10009786 [Phytophthora nicotianae]KUF88639.1 hypothetical protein AM588_10001871 [Phytophthora nicotianae]